MTDKHSRFQGSEQPSMEQRIRRLNEIGIALSAERNQSRLLEKILSSARELTAADAGTLYLLDADTQLLRFALVQNDQLGIYLGGPGQPGVELFQPIPMSVAGDETREPLVVVWSVLNKQTVRIRDAYDPTEFDFSGTRAFDAQSGYRSHSFLTVPLINHEGEVFAALQLINKRADADQIQPFSDTDQELAESLASQAAVALTNQRLIDEMKGLFDSFTRVLATAIDKKSPHTGNHCRRVPDATLFLAEAVSASDHPAVRDFVMTEADFYELRTAAWLHDCGKVVTPHHVMEKSRKLETVFDRIELVAARVEILLRDLEIQALRQQLEGGQQHTLQLNAQREQLIDDLTFLRRTNVGAEFVTDDDLQRIASIAEYRWIDAAGIEQGLLTEDELKNLSVRRGTLNAEERQIMNDHMVATLDMLEQLPFPRHLRRVPEYAGCHHERMDGKGYPRGLRREQMSIPARIMGIADVFEALTAKERPYKEPMKLSQALAIMGRMAEEGHLDPDLFAVFVDERVYERYAAIHLAPEQIDLPDLAHLNGLKSVVKKDAAE
ncbi:MAG: HD domain-containing phosphohydrolase [Nitrincola lacisaponensis]|uniref:HD domain-containing phosphohydrolase n=1 Tax=Nitrincola lacisaponensis TaxID=267850 RepID=UPI00391D962C